MADHGSALSFNICILQEQHLVVLVSGEPLETGTNIVISHTGILDQNELAMLLSDIFGMALRAMVDPDSYRISGVVYDAEGNIKENLSETEIPF